MYRVMLVDDEPLFKIALKSLINWDKNGFSIVCEAANGKEALDCLENKSVDIILTDIRMPVMDGVDLIKNVKRKYPSIFIVVLSAYEDFHLVKNALLTGAEEYLLKSDIDNGVILDALKGIRKKLELINKKENEESREKTYIYENIALLKEIFLRSLLDEATFTDEEQIKLKFDYYKIGVKKERLVVGVIIINGRFSNKIEKNAVMLIAVKNFLIEIFKHETEFECFINENGNIIVIQSFHNIISEIKIIEKINENMGMILSSLKSFLNIHVTIGVSSSANGYINIPKLYKEASKAAEYRFFNGECNIIFYKDLPAQRSSLECKEVIDIRNQILKDVEILDFEAVKNGMSKLIYFILLNKYSDIESTYRLFCDIYSMIVSRYIQFGLQSSYFSADNRTYSVLFDCCTLKEIQVLMFKFIDDFEGSIGLHLKKKYGDLVGKVVNYLVKNYYKSEISLAGISEEFNVNLSYLSARFKEEMGQSFISYLTNLRIEKAKELLIDKKMRVGEIANKLGYPNQRYFNKVFKKVVGVSPLEYWENNILKK